MKRIVILLAIILLSKLAFAQQPPKTLPFLAASKYVPPAKAKGLVSSKNFPTIFNENVTFALTGDRNLNTWGNFLSVNIVKPAATLAFANLSSNKQGKVYLIESGSITGSVDQDIVSVFSANKLNSSVELRGNVAYILRLPYIGTKFFYTPSTQGKVDEAVDNVNKYYDYKIDEYLLLTTKLTVTLDSFKRLDVNTITPSQALLRKRLEFKLSQLEQNGRANLTKGRTDSTAKVERQAVWSTIRIGWLDFFGAVKQQKLNLYDSTAAFAAQVQEHNFTQYKYGTALNLYLSSTFRGLRYFNGIYRVEYAHSRSNNSGELDTYDVSTSGSTKSVAPNQTRQISRKLSAYQNVAYVESYFHTIRLDVLKELLANHRAYLHLAYETAKASEKITEYTGDVPLPTKNIKNLTVGFLISFTNKDKPKSLLNVEPYITFRDLSDVYSQNINVLHGQEIGVRTTFPFGLPSK
jgi:hypothetical protein